jgi:hypothetical protein
MMASEQQTGVTTNGTASSQLPTFTVKAGLAQMLKGGVIMDVINADQVSFCYSNCLISQSLSLSLSLSLAD